MFNILYNNYYVLHVRLLFNIIYKHEKLCTAQIIFIILLLDFINFVNIILVSVIMMLKGVKALPKSSVHPCSTSG